METLELILILIYVFVGLIFFVGFGILAFVVIIKELRGKEVKHDEAKKVDASSDCKKAEYWDDE